MSDLRTDLEAVRASARDRLASADTAEAVEALRHELLGRSGALTSLLKQLGSGALAGLSGLPGMPR